MELKKSLSQHLLKDKNVLKKMLSKTDITKKDVVLEIGAGTGELTSLLKDIAGSVYAVEIDKGFSPYLDKLSSQNKNIRIVYQDFLKLKLADLASQHGVLKVIGNIPYGLTGPILFKIFMERKYLKKAYLTFQREVAERIVAKPKTRMFGTLSVISQVLSNVKLEFFIPPQVFVPPPQVESAFVSFTFYEEYLTIPETFFQFVKNCFRHKRKLLFNSLKAVYSISTVEFLFEKAKLHKSVRAEEILPQKFLEMFYCIERENG
ncbi:MAG: 16S rRNA (adenine(1518)-N(6)/adenine(1519)-N(6))-dimethyltransferase RsmA [Deltaproteobacteria bacterium]|nr:16S rRNA (adenine(1518)-N(6)/adenine(1519)-N(6))-dimethyltransferase RsmA [Deltaproteobacteria bacterium]